MIYFNIYQNSEFNFKFNNKSTNEFVDILNNITYKIFNWNDLKNKYYLSNLVFPEYTNNNNKKNIWNNFNLRPFKMCPCKYDELTNWSNNSLLNLIIFDDTKIIGFCVISNESKYYLINILCTNISQGIGTIIIEFIKKHLYKKPIKLESTFNSEKFYLKKGFIKLHTNIMLYSN